MFIHFFDGEHTVSVEDTSERLNEIEVNNIFIVFFFFSFSYHLIEK